MSTPSTSGDVTVSEQDLVGFACSPTGYVMYRLFGMTDFLVHKVLDRLPPDTQKALQASCSTLRRLMNTRVKTLTLKAEDGPEQLVGELLHRFPSVQHLSLDHISWSTITLLLRQSPLLLRGLRVVNIDGWKSREKWNLIEVEHAIGSLLGHTHSLASLTINQVKVGVHCLPKSVLAGLTSLTQLRLGSGSVDCQFAFNAICLLTRLRRVELEISSHTCGLRSITSLAGLCHLHLECQMLTVPDLEAIGQLGSLTSLSLEGKLPDSIPNVWGNLGDLEALALHHCAISSCEVIGLSRLTSIAKLSLDVVEFVISDLSRVSTLTKLKLTGQPNEPKALTDIISAAASSPSLASLLLKYSGTLDESTELAFGRLKALTRLSISCAMLGSGVVCHMNQLTALTNLETLDYDRDIDSDLLRLLGKLPKLREIVSDGAFSISCELDVCLPHLTLIRAQDLRDAGVGLRAFGFLAPQLRSLNILQSSVEAPSLVALGCGCGHLTRLKMVYTSADDAALQAIGKGCPRLSYLALSAPAVTSKALTSLAEGCTALTKLKLGEVSNISDVGLIALARNCSRIVKLYLDDAALITDGGVVALMLLRELEKFTITGARHVTQVSMTALSTCPRLRVLKVLYCGINKEETKDIFLKRGVQITV